MRQTPSDWSRTMGVVPGPVSSAANRIAGHSEPEDSFSAERLNTSHDADDINEEG